MDFDPNPYEAFLAAKGQENTFDGFRPIFMPSHLMDFQGALTEWAIEKGRGALIEDCGLGKTLQQLVWAENVVRHTNRPVLIQTPLAVTYQTQREAAKFDIEAHICSDGKPRPGINITNYERLHYFDPNDFAGSVCDECFAAGTKIDVVTEEGEGQRDIENIRPGDYIINAVGVDRVSDIHRREVPYAVKVTIAGKSIIVSPNHPFFTQQGWRGTMDLWPGAKVMATVTAVRMVQEGFCSKDRSSRENEILRSILFSEMAYEPTGTFGKSPHAGDCSEKRLKEVNMVAGDGSWAEDIRTIQQIRAHREGPTNSFIHIESYEPQTFRAWGEWSSDDRNAGGFEGCNVRELDTGICFVTGPIEAGISDALQNRFSERRAENRNRGGWSLPSIEESTGRQEGCDADFVRVDSVEVLELGHPELDKFRDADGKLYFYDIGATRHPSFSVNGLLVHNSSILKSFDGTRRRQITEFMRKLPYRLLCTATAAPNEYTELGTSSEALGYLGYMDMLTRFFKNNQGNSIKPHVDRHGRKAATQLDDNAKWRFKGHAEVPFWQWVCSWSRAVRKPSDLGFDDGGFALPPLVERQHLVDTRTMPEGKLFALPAVGLLEQREERRRTIQERCEAAAALINGSDEPAIAWCHLNPEGDLLEKLIPGCVQVSGRDNDDDKERKFLQFLTGEKPKLVTKGKIGAWGLNFQHCNRVVTFPTHSFEEYYQQVRRCWRFGQKRPVHVDIISTEGEKDILANLQRKAVAADRMFTALTAHMNEAMGINRTVAFTKQEELPSWL